MQLTFQYRETWVHRVNPSLKFLLSVALFFVILFSPSVNFLIYLSAGSLLLFYGFNGHSRLTVLLLSLPFALLFLSSSASMMFFGEGQTTWLKWGLVHITEESFVRGLHIGFKSIHFALIGLTLALTTRPVYLFYSLMQQCKLPAKFAYSFMAAIRLLPMMAQEFQTLRYALKVRGVESGKGPAAALRKLKAYSIPLLAQSIRKAQRIAVAMEAKRFSTSGSRTYYYRIGFSRSDAAFALYWAASAGAAMVLASRFPVL